MFDPAAASVVANTVPIVASMPSNSRQSASVKVTTPSVTTRPEPVPGNFVQTVVVKGDVVVNGQIVLGAGQVLTKTELDQAVAKFGADKVTVVPVTLDGLIVISNPLQVPGLKKGDIVTPTQLADLIAKYGEKAFEAVKVDPAFQVTPEGIVPKKPEVVASPTKP